MTKARRIFVVDDDDEIRSLLKAYLEKHQFYVETAETGEIFLEIFNQNPCFDLVILDIMLPGEDGFSICRQLRTKSHVPVIMLTANSDEMDRIIGLEIGADDYLAKPFNPRELLARMKAILRRMEHIEPSPSETAKAHTILTFANFSLNTVSRELTDPSGNTDSLTGADYNLLTLFLQHPGKVLSRDQIAETTRGRDSAPLDRFIDVHISRLRQRLGEDARHPQLIKTVRGEGYILTADVSKSILTPDSL
ncbi:response regulator transcription factor [Marinomonas sp. 15G1-11]|uniref:Response regulator transcription factor n=1 Tax=Marinomonas phaeophyticola TaxID=3004091 RepID=A0ABT4JUV5_9GAMM|nr:response regulator transcription factor [Marinomonas sp. 15G1-11]MCZ2722026.1 response regulator transcription factor [Marinomonas sp. 15G1-11]